MVAHLYRFTVSLILAGLLALLGGCVVTQLSAGFSLAPPGPFFSIGFSNGGGGNIKTLVAGVAGTATFTTAPATAPAPVPFSHNQPPYRKVIPMPA